jgi:hypothetical protein
MAPPIDASEFEAHKDLSRIVVDFLCRNSDKAYSVNELAEFTGVKEEDINYLMLKLSFHDVINNLSGLIVHRTTSKNGNPRAIKIEDVTINGIVYYRCVKLEAQKS